MRRTLCELKRSTRLAFRYERLTVELEETIDTGRVRNRKTEINLAVTSGWTRLFLPTKVRKKGRPKGKK